MSQKLSTYKLLLVTSNENAAHDRYSLILYVLYCNHTYTKRESTRRVQNYRFVQR